MGRIREFSCVTCARVFRPEYGPMTCPDCGPYRGTLDVALHLPSPDGKENLTGSPVRSIWGFLDFLPVRDPGVVASVTVGNTPLMDAPALARALGVARVWIKDETRNPSASLKDRATAVGLAAALEAGKTTVAAASTGNAASSLACLAAASGMRSVVFLPESAPLAKIAQVLIHGARVFQVSGTYDEAFDLCAEAVRRFGWFSRNTATNPYLGEGKKTVSLEIARELGWDVPDKVFVPAGDGAILGGVWKGFQDLRDAGWTARTPELIGVQAEGSAALFLAWEKGLDVPEPVEPDTLADSISVALPRDGVKALRAVRRSGGRFVTVSDEAILEAVRTLARRTGVFAEPSGATSLAGALALAGAGGLSPKDRIALLVTGSGLKDIDSGIAASGGAPPPIEPTLEAVEAALRRNPIRARGADVENLRS